MPSIRALLSGIVNNKSTSAPWKSRVDGMPRTRKIRAALNFDPPPNAEDGPAMAEAILKAPFFSMTDDDIIEIFGDSFPYEMKTLMNASPTAEGAGNKEILGSYGPEKTTPSKFLYKAEYSEVNRTIVGALALKWILADDYQHFTQYQAPEFLKLKPESFRDIRSFIFSEIRDPDDLYALVISMIINDLGKADKIVQSESRASMRSLRPRKTDSIKKLSSPSTTMPIITTEPEEMTGNNNKNTQQQGPPHHHLAKPNHDEKIFESAKENKIALLKEFNTKRGHLHEWLLLGLEMGAKLNVPQFAQAENVPGSLASIKVMDGRERALNFKLIEIILDVAGAQGHMDSRCCKSMLEPTWNSFATSRALLADVACHRLTERQAYDRMLQARAALLEKTGFETLRTEVPDERALLRLVTMGRALEKKGSASIIQAAFRSLAEDERRRLVDGLSVDGTTDGTAIIPYYAPSLFANIFRLSGSAPDEKKVAALAHLLRFLARVYRGTRPKPELGKALIVECKLDFVQDMFKSEDTFWERLGDLDTVDIPAEAYTADFEDWV